MADRIRAAISKQKRLDFYTDFYTDFYRGAGTRCARGGVEAISVQRSEQLLNV